MTSQTLAYAAPLLTATVMLLAAWRIYGFAMRRHERWQAFRQSELVAASASLRGEPGRPTVKKPAEAK